MRKNIIYILGFLALTFSTSSCLKDDLGEDWTDSLAGKMYAQIVKPGLQSFTINNGVAPQTISLFVNVATDALPSADITITFAFDPDALAAYNVKNGTDFVLCPNISMPSTTLVIPAGTRNGYFDVVVSQADLLSLTTEYVVPVSITAASNGVVIASNFKTVLMQVPVANQWEGSYAMHGYSLRAGDPVLTGNWQAAWKLGTTGAKSVTFWKTQLWATGGTVGGIGPWKLTVDDSGGPTAHMPVLVTDAANAAVKNNPAGNNYYDPATKTFYISVYWGTGPTNRAATDTLIYTGPY
jgi:hypothetical protein